MSTMKWTWKQDVKMTALQDIQIPNSKKPLIKKGETILVSEIEQYVDGRGNPQGTTTTQYYINYLRPLGGGNSTMQPPEMNQNVKRVKLGEDVAKISDSVSDSTNGDSDKLSNNNTILLLALVVVGYFAYKQYKK